MRDCDTAGLAGVLDARRLFFGLAGLLALLAFEPAAAREPVSLVTVESRELEERLPLTGTLTAKRAALLSTCLLYTSPSPRDRQKSRMPSSA